MLFQWKKFVFFLLMLFDWDLWNCLTILVMKLCGSRSVFKALSQYLKVIKQFEQTILKLYFCASNTNWFGLCLWGFYCASKTSLHVGWSKVFTYYIINEKNNFILKDIVLDGFCYAWFWRWSRARIKSDALI